jgi:hypothetical protein
MRAVGRAAAAQRETGMVRRCLAYVVIAGFSAVGSLTFAHADDRAVIELFTSQGCSSCPAADKLLGQLATDPALIAISLPMDVWDYLGWKDTLADPRNTVRWKAYSKSRGDRQVYTPQAVINGAMHALGSDRAAIQKAIAKSRQNPRVMTVPVKIAANGRHAPVSVSVGAGGAEIGAGADVWIVGLAKAVTVKITRGENKGKTVTYHNVVRSWDRFEGWNGKPGTWTVPAPRHEGVDAAAVIVQTSSKGMPGAILGAAIASLR